MKNCWAKSNSMKLRLNASGGWLANGAPAILRD